MNLLKELNLTPNKRMVGRNVIVDRRESVINGIDKQIYIFDQLLSGEEVVRDKNKYFISIPSKSSLYSIDKFYNFFCLLFPIIFCCS